MSSAMIPGFLTGRLPGYKKLLLLLTVVWSIIGIPGNYFGPRGTGQTWMLLATIRWASIVAVIGYSIIWRKQRPAL